MKISRLIISNFRQFKHLDLDLTYSKHHESKAGRPLEKVCFIGENGTGKSTLLKLLTQFLKDPSATFRVHEGRIGIKFTIGTEALFKLSALDTEPSNESEYRLMQEMAEAPQGSRKHQDLLQALQEIKQRQLQAGDSLFGLSHPYLFKAEDFEHTDYFKELFFDEGANNSPTAAYFKQRDKDFDKSILRRQVLLRDPSSNRSMLSGYFNDSKANLLVYSPLESQHNLMLSEKYAPDTTLNDALTYFKSFPYYHEVSYDFLTSFWDLVIYQVKKREDDRKAFEEKPENLNKTKRQLIEEFNNSNPDFLKHLSDVWGIVLDKAGLYFDYGAKSPLQLNDNLEAFIKLKTTRKPLAYSQLSSGIRHLIFRLGYLTALFYKKDIKYATVLIDEPESSIFPNLLYNLIDVYTKISPNTQFFFATHSPIIASQFDPEERIILEFNEQGAVEARKGVSPEGDDPNDLLVQDFGLENILGKKGLEQLHRYIELKTLIKNEPDQAHKDELVKEYLKIGNQYHFGNETYSKKN